MPTSSRTAGSALDAYNSASKDEAEELYGDYVDTVDLARDALLEYRDTYARTLDAEAAEAYEDVFNDLARKRLPSARARARLAPSGALTRSEAAITVRSTLGGGDAKGGIHEGQDHCCGCGERGCGSLRPDGRGERVLQPAARRAEPPTCGSRCRSTSCSSDSSPGRSRSRSFWPGCPSRYKPIIRSRLYYGLVEELGIDYRYDVDVTYTGASWENAVLQRPEGTGDAGRSNLLPGRLQRAGRHARRRPEPLHRRPVGREVADRPRSLRRQYP